MFEFNHNVISFKQLSEIACIEEFLPESVEEVSSRFDAVRIVKVPSEDSKSGHWKSVLLICGVILMVILPSLVRAEQKCGKKSEMTSCREPLNFCSFTAIVVWELIQRQYKRSLMHG